MGEVLFELQQILRSKQEKLTPQEVNVFLTCKANAIRDLTVGACVASSVVYLATWRLSKLFRISLSVGAGTISGMWRFGRSLDSCLDHILALDGSRMQKELANLMVNKYRDDPWRMQLISKHFYSEEVFDDSTSDQPKLRWRYRNIFFDNVAHSQRTHDSYFQSDSDSKKTELESKQVPMKPSIEPMMDPLDCIFGYGAGKEFHHPDASSTKARVLNRSHRRSHRRRRMHHQEASPNSQQAQAQGECD